MGRVEQSGPRKSKKKSKGRMSYLRRQRAGNSNGGGGGGGGGQPDTHGLMYGDYESVNYHAGKPKWRNSNRGGKSRREPLRTGMKGFIGTTNNREGDSVREAYNILNEYSESLVTENEGKELTDETNTAAAEKNATGVSGRVQEVGDITDKVAVVEEVRAEAEPVKEKPQTSGTEEAVMKDDDPDEDIDDELANELKELKSEKTIRKFQSVDTGVKNVIFISTTIENPTELAYRIFDDVSTKQQTKSKYLLRFLPIEVTCNINNFDEVKSKSKEVLERYLKTGYISFRIVVNARHNNKFEKEAFIKSLAEFVSQINPLSFVDFSNPTYTIIVEVLKTTLCLGVVKDFVRFKKYNLLETGTPAPEKSSGDNNEPPESNVKKQEEVKEKQNVGPNVGDTSELATSSESAEITSNLKNEAEEPMDDKMCSDSITVKAKIE